VDIIQEGPHGTGMSVADVARMTRIAGGDVTTLERGVRH